jgi:hypothetical protein
VQRSRVSLKVRGTKTAVPIASGFCPQDRQRVQTESRRVCPHRPVGLRRVSAPIDSGNSTSFEGPLQGAIGIALVDAVVCRPSHSVRANFMLAPCAWALVPLHLMAFTNCARFS